VQTNVLVALVFSALSVFAEIPDASAEAASSAQEVSEARHLFVVEIRTGPGWDITKPANEQPHFKAHSRNLQELRESGYIVMGARYSDIGLIIFSATSAEEVRQLMDRDPSMTAGTFSYAIHALNVFYPGTVGTVSSSSD